MIHIAPHPLKGKTILLAKTIKHHNGDLPKGSKFLIEDWQDRIFGKSWMRCNGNPTCLVYGMRSVFANLPTDDNVIYGHDEKGIGHIIHATELGEEVKPLPEPPKEGK